MRKLFCETQTFLSDVQCGLTPFPSSSTVAVSFPLQPSAGVRRREPAMSEIDLDYGPSPRRSTEWVPVERGVWSGQVCSST